MSIESIDADQYDEDGNPIDAAFEDQLQFNREVSEALRRLRVNKAAQERLRALEQTDTEPFDAGTLREMLQRPPEPPMRIDRLIPWQASTLVVAQRKTGKTVLVLNLAHSLLTGEDFLGRFEVRPVAGKIGILNYEVSGQMLSRWADERGIDRDRLYMVNLRGRRNPMSNAEDRARLARQLREQQVEHLVVDTFARAFTGRKVADSGEVGAFLNDLSYFARTEAGASEVTLTTHAGWTADARARDSSALEDWPDAIITMVRDDEDLRYLRAIGRDVDVDEDQLAYDEATRTLTLAGTGSRKQSKTNRRVEDLATYVRRAAGQQPGASNADLIRLIRAMPDAPSFQDRDVSKAAQFGSEHGFLKIVDHGPGKKKEHYPTTPSNPVQTPSGTAPTNPVHPVLYMDGVGVQGSDTEALDGVTICAVENCREQISENRQKHGKHTCAMHALEEKHFQGEQP